MSSTSSTIRLIYPQWQGGIINHLLPELHPDDASLGYFMGAKLLNFLAPPSDQMEIEVPVSLDINDRKVERGINSYSAIFKQTKSALNIIEKHNPDRIITLGGDCAVSIVPFTYMAAKYLNDIAIIWIDAHPDVNLPYDKYQGYHAMALTACLGMGDEELLKMLPTKVEASKALLVGLRCWDEGMKERQDEIGIKALSPSEVSDNSMLVMDWLKQTGVSKVVIHFDLDVLDPSDLIAAVGVESNGMKTEHVIRVINDISCEYDVVALTIAEHLPRVAIQLKKILHQLPLFKSR